MEGFSTPEKRSDQVVLEANLDYWDRSRLPRLHRIVFDNTLGQKEAVELVKTEEGRVDLVTGLSPLETLRVAESPFAKVAKNRGAPTTIYGTFNMRKTGSPWGDVRLRQAVNYAINREDLIRYAAKGNGVIIPALVPPQGLGYAPDLVPYPFNLTTTRELLQEASYPNGLSLTLIAGEVLEIQATVVSKMLEQAGFTVDLQVLDAATYQRKMNLNLLEQPAEQQQWDLALRSTVVELFFPLRGLHSTALSGPTQWVFAAPELYQLYDQVLRTVDREQQRGLIRQMERHTAEQAYFLFLYSPIPLHAVNKEVVVVPHLGRWLTEISVTEQHWSVRKQKTAGHE